MKSLITAYCSAHFLALFIIFLLPSPATSQPPSPANPYSGQISPQIGIFVFVITVFIILMAFFSIYVRHCSEYSSFATATTRSGVITGRYMQSRRGLDPAIKETFPVFNYSAVKEMKLGKGALECAVCLNEFEDDETLRLIPNCDHVYHAECIDVWLESHATCPVCRANLVPVTGESINAPVIVHIQNDDVPSESMEQPLNATRRARRLIRSSTRTNTSGRRRWFGLFLRSHSTGHVAVTHLENTERFTLRLPDEFRRQIIIGKLNRTTSCFVEGSPRVMNRTMLGGSYKESINRTGFDQADRWTFSLTPPFFSAASASVQPSKAGDGLHKPSLPLPPV